MRNYLYVVVIAALIPLEAMAEGLADQVSNTGGGATFDHAVSPLTGAQIVAAKGSSSALMKASRVSSFSSPSNSIGPSIANFSVWSLTVSTPLNKNGDDTDVANLDGLVNASSIELTYSHFRVPGRLNPTTNAKGMAKVEAVCARVHAAMKEQGIQPSSDQGCDSNEIDRFGSSADKHDFESAFWDINNTNRFIWGANAKLGYQNFEFIDALETVKHKHKETPWAVGGFIAYNPDSWHMIFTLSMQYQDTFKDSTNSTVCPLLDGSGARLICLSGPIGRPKETKKKLISLEARREFQFAGLGITTTYDFEEKILGIELPIYFVKDKEGKFNAGIKGGWRDDNHDFTASIFIGTAFELFK
jgi:hypothetical protein